MRYEGMVYRPPSEARSLIIQVTIGCSHNRCTFCSMYKDKKFRIRKTDEIIEDIRTAKSYYGRVEKVFLADGDALILKSEELVKILKEIRIRFPECKRVGIYATAKDILMKTDEELELLKSMGLGIVYLGIESGSQKILDEIKKDVDIKDVIEAGKKVKNSKIKLSVMIISGLGGVHEIEEHAYESAMVINKIDPDYLSLLTLMVEQGTELFDDVKSGKFQLLTPKQVMKETKIFVENLELSNCVFRSNHASNYVPLAGVLGEEKQKILDTIDYCIGNSSTYKKERYRGL